MLATTPMKVQLKAARDMVDRFLVDPHGSFANDFIATMIQVWYKIFSCNCYIVCTLLQAARDAGVPSYVEWREKCQLDRPQSFQELTASMSSDDVAKIQSVYRYVV